jgi:hypothetical protein
MIKHPDGRPEIVALTTAAAQGGARRLNGTTCPISRWSIRKPTSSVMPWSGYSRQPALLFNVSFPEQEDKRVSLDIV